MKKKALVVLLVCVMGIAALGIGSAGAAATPPWYNCSLQIVGALPTFYFMQATDLAATPAFTARFFTIDSNLHTNPQAKAYLASALTGYASGGFVSLLLPDIAAFAVVQGVTAGQQ
jgi:hypothetical protein